MASVACAECGAAMTVSFETKLYRCPAPVVLKGIEVRRCPSCGEEDVVYPRPALLQKKIAETLAAASERLGPGELRFLRRYLGLTATELAQTFGVAPETVSRWESATNPQRMGTTAEKLLRVMVSRAVPAQLVRAAASKDEVLVPRLELRFDEDTGVWLAPAAAPARTMTMGTLTTTCSSSQTEVHAARTESAGSLFTGRSQSFTAGAPQAHTETHVDEPIAA